MQKQASQQEPVKTVLVIVTGFLIVYVLSAWRWALFTALIIGIAGLASAFLARWIDYLWMQLAKLLSLIIPNILLSAVFYLILTPFAWLSGILGEKNPLGLKNTQSSMFRDLDRVYGKESFEKPW
jgi:hypothetical protein